MRSFLAVFQREVHERRLILAVALCTGGLPFLVALLPGTASLGIAEFRSGAALVVACLLSAFLALALGSSMVARDLGERRLGFYFGRPLSGWSIWGGKLAAALLLVWGSAALVLLPVALSGDLAKQPVAQVLSILVAGGPFLLLAVHALQVMIRARSRWLLLDLAAPLGLALLAWITYSRLRDALIPSSAAVPIGFAAALLIALLAGSTVQTIWGRTDLRRSHRLLSLSLWGTAAALFLGIAGWSSWVLAAGAGDLEDVDWVQGAPAGSWILLSGDIARGGGYPAAFLFDTATGRSVPTLAIAGRSAASSTVFTADGRTALVTGREESRPVLYRLDLTSPQARPIPVPMDLHGSAVLTPSPDGRFLAAYNYLERRVVVEDLEAHRPVASISLPANVLFGRMIFTQPSVLRLVLFPAPAGVERDEDGWERWVEVQDVALQPGAEARITSVARLRPRLTGFNTVESPDGERLLLYSSEDSLFRAVLFDVRSGKAVRLQRARQRGEPGWGQFLADGRLVLASEHRGEVRLDLLEKDGSWMQGFRFPASRSLSLGGQPEAGVLAGSLLFHRRWHGFYLHLAERRLQSLGEVSPASSIRSGPGSPEAKLFVQASGGLIRIDPETGTRHTLLSRPKIGNFIYGWISYSR